MCLLFNLHGNPIISLRCVCDSSKLALLNDGHIWYLTDCPEAEGRSYSIGFYNRKKRLEHRLKSPLSPATKEDEQITQSVSTCGATALAIVSNHVKILVFIIQFVKLVNWPKIYRWPTYEQHFFLEFIIENDSCGWTGLRRGLASVFRCYKVQ